MNATKVYRSHGGNNSNDKPIATGMADNPDGRQKFRAKLEAGLTSVTSIQLPRTADPKKRAGWMQVRDELALAI